MFWTVLLAICALVCILISFILQGKQTSNQVSQNRQKIYIQNRITINEQLYEFTASTDQGMIKFENSIPFPIGSYIDADIHDGQITVYSESVQQNQLFRVLSLIEKWRYSGVVFLLAAMATAIMQSEKFAEALTGFIVVIVIAITMFIAVRSKKKYFGYCQEEALGNIIQIPYKLVATNKNQAYIAYSNAEDLPVIAVIPKHFLKKHPHNIAYHTASKSVILVSKKLLKITNIVSLICAGIFAIAIAIMSVLSL